MAPGWPAAMAPGQLTRNALQTIRESVQYFWIALLITLLGSLVGGAVLGIWYGGGVGVLTSTSRSASHPLVGGGAALGFDALLGVLVLATLITVIIAWLRWRLGGDQLITASAEFGSAATQMAQRSRSDVSLATYMFVVILMVAIAIAAAVVFIALSGISITTGANATSTSVHISPGLQNEISGVQIGGIVVESVIGLLLYGFATRAIVNALAPYARPNVRVRADAGRRYVMIGVLVSFVGLAAPVVPYLSLLGIVVALLEVYGYLELRRALDEVIAQPIHCDPDGKAVDRFLAL